MRPEFANTAMKHILIVAFAIVWLGANASALLATPMRFWFSTSNVAPTGPEAPVITGLQGSTRRLYIWAQPATMDLAQPYNVTMNRFRTLQNFSLNIFDNAAIVGTAPIIDFVDGSFEIYNPTLDGSTRYEYVSDSLTPMDESGPLASAEPEADVLAGAVDSINGLQAFSFSMTNRTGLGHSPAHPTAGCHPGDSFCASTSDGSPAWLIGAVSFKTLAPSGTASLYLRIGQNGMNYVADAMQASAVTFGVNAAGAGPTYDARIVGPVTTHRGITLPGDEPDAIINAVAAIEGDFNGDAVVDATDYVVWRNGLGTTYTPEQYDLWRAKFGTPAGSGSFASSAVPEPGAVILLMWGVVVAYACRR
jgi:hypothetical protein